MREIAIGLIVVLLISCTSETNETDEIRFFDESEIDTTLNYMSDDGNIVEVSVDFNVEKEIHGYHTLYDENEPYFPIKKVMYSNGKRVGYNYYYAATDSGRIKRKDRMITIAGGEQILYSCLYDDQGTFLQKVHDINFSCQSETEKDGEITYYLKLWLHKHKSDSSSVFIGDYDKEFNHIEEQKLVRFNGSDTVEVEFENSDKRDYLRGSFEDFKVIIENGDTLEDGYLHPFEIKISELKCDGSPAYTPLDVE